MNIARLRTAAEVAGSPLVALTGGTPMMIAALGVVGTPLAFVLVIWAVVRSWPNGSHHVMGFARARRSAWFEANIDRPRWRPVRRPLPFIAIAISRADYDAHRPSGACASAVCAVVGDTGVGGVR
jgi:hypothetical protein